jgi:hypothetical protein
MNASAVPPTTVAWKWPGTRSVLCAMRLICSVPKVTPVIPPTKPKITSDVASAAKPGSPQGAFFSHPNTPCVTPRRRWPTSMPAGIVNPWIMLARTARYIA